MKLKQYFENINGEVVIGDVIKVYGSTNKDGIYLMLSSEKEPAISQSAQEFKIYDNGEYKYCGHGGLCCQIGDECAEVKILYNIFNKLNKNTMKITNLVKKILDVDTRKLVEAGFIDGDLALTEEGTQELLGILFLQNKEELVKVADEKISEKNNR